MKKILQIFPILILCLLLSSCSTNNEKDITDNNTSSTTANSTTTSPMPSSPEVVIENNTTEQWPTVPPESIQKGDFRNSNWGDDFNDVFNKEDVVEYDKNNILIEDNLNGIDVTGLYKFENNKLVIGFYSIKEEHSNENLYYEDYLKLKKDFISVYGEPTEDIEHWYRDLYKDDMDHIGFAISLGDVTFSTNWVTDTSIISITLTGDDYEIDSGIIYKPIDYESEEDLSGI